MTWKREPDVSGWSTNFAGWGRFATLLVAFSALNFLPSSAQAAEAAVVDEGADEQAQQLILDLGDFTIRELRPTRNETVKVRFAMHLALSERVDEALAARLEFWQHRLRDQVITAVRAAPTVELLEPELGRLRSQILVRINRLLKGTMVEDVLFASFTFRLE